MLSTEGKRGEGVLVLVTCPGFLSHFDRTKVKKRLHSDKCDVDSQAWVKGKERHWGARGRTTDTFKNSQPCRVMREPDRIARQAGILPSVIIRHISQLQDFHFLVRGVKASGLENNKRKQTRQEAQERKREPWVKDCEREKGIGGAFSSSIRHHLPKMYHRGSASVRESPPVSVSGGAG